MNMIDHAMNLTKRELFAAMAMQGLLANPERYKYITGLMTVTTADGTTTTRQPITQDEASAKNARKAVYMADALIAALSLQPRESK